MALDGQLEWKLLPTSLQQKMVQNFLVTLAVLCSFAALALRPEPQYAWQEDEGDVTTCLAVKTYKKAVPHSGVNVDAIKPLLLTTDLETCVRACCDQGQAVCQYAWLFEGKCLAVSCHFKPASCYAKFISDYSSEYVQMGYYGGEGEMEPTTSHPKKEPTPKHQKLKPITEDQEPESTTEYQAPEPTTKYQEPEPTTEYQESEPTTEYQESEPTTEYRRQPTSSRVHQQRPSVTKPAPTVNTTTPHTMDDIILAELEDALNSSSPTSHEVKPQSTSSATSRPTSDLVSAGNITAIEMQEGYNIGQTYVVVLLSCFFGFLFVFFLFLGCGYYLTHRRKEHKDKKVSYTVVDHDDKHIFGKGSYQPPSSVVLSDSETDEEHTRFSMVGMTASNKAIHGKKHSSLASGLLPM